jgi:hypothetical protein
VDGLRVEQSVVGQGIGVDDTRHGAAQVAAEPVGSVSGRGALVVAMNDALRLSRIYWSLRTRQKVALCVSCPPMSVGH